MIRQTLAIVLACFAVACLALLTLLHWGVQREAIRRNPASGEGHRSLHIHARVDPDRNQIE